MAGMRLTHYRATSRVSAICRFTPDRYFDQVATACVPAIIDHLFWPLARTWKQLGLELFQVLQKPSCVSFQVPSLLAPALATGSRVIFPSGVNTILNLTLDSVDAVNG